MSPGGLTARRLVAHCAVALLATLVLAVCAPLLGGGISIKRALAELPWRSSYDSPDALIFWGTRVPRVLAALVTGGALAIAGLATQAVLRNALAEPYILGISAGAGMGKAASLFMLGHCGWWTGGVGTLGFCFLGAMIPVLLLQGMASRQRRFSPVTLLLVGVMINIVLSAVMMLIQTFANPQTARQVQLWWLGSLDIVGYRSLLLLAPFIAAGAIVLMLRGRTMNLLGFDTATASHLGLHVEREVRVLLWSAALLASAAVALAGPIGFVGLLVPHVLRLVFGVDNRLLAPLCVVYGAAFLLLCDMVGWRGAGLISSTSAAELPVGVVTALLGGPLFLFLLVRGSGSAVNPKQVSL